VPPDRGVDGAVAPDVYKTIAPSAFVPGFQFAVIELHVTEGALNPVATCAAIEIAFVLAITIKLFPVDKEIPDLEIPTFLD
jgi:hypothetical protein